MRLSATRRNRLWLLTGLLLFAAALRIGHIVDFLEWLDEIWAVWHVQDSLADVLARTTTDWPPTFGVLTWGWMQIAGRHLEVFRWVSVLYSILGLAFTYRAALAFNHFWAGRAAPTQKFYAAALSAAVFATMGFTVFSGVDARPYAPLLAFGPLAFWMTIRWLQNATKGSAILVVLALSATLYIGFTALTFIAYLSLVVVVTKPRLLPQWIGIGILVLVLVLPLAPQFVANSAGRLNSFQPLPPFLEAMTKVYVEFGGTTWFFLPLVAAALLLIALAVRFPGERRKVLLLFIWALVPVSVYWGLNNNEFMKARYIWWVAIGLALFIGYAVVRLPRLAQWCAIAIFVLSPLVPVDFNMYRHAVTTSPPYRSVFSWFANHIRPGDVLVIDPYCRCGDRPYGWDYFVRLYFPSGYLPITDHPGAASRVWYLSTEGWEQDEQLLAEIRNGRKPSIYVGPWYFLLRLYEGPPSWEGVSFGGRIRFHGAEILETGTLVADNETFQVKLWWSADQPLDRDYSFSLAVLDPQGRLIAQDDRPPHAPETPEQTSAWQPGSYYEDVRTIQLRRGLREGAYDLVVAVYQWWDGIRLLPEDNTLWDRIGENGSYLKLEQLTILNID